jgi:predicted  nucleic acid-binding Zn-ribbon protein
LEVFTTHIDQLKSQALQMSHIRRRIDEFRLREARMEQALNALTQEKESMQMTIKDLEDQIRALKTVGLQNGNSLQQGQVDSDVKQYINGLIREIDKSLKNWED